MKRLPIVFCLDVSPSMGLEWEGISSIQLLNEAVEKFIKELREDIKTKAAAEIAFVTFSTNIEIDTPFESVVSISTPKFKTVDYGGTRMAQAVLRSVEKIEAKKKEYIDKSLDFYAPFLVLVTDGNPDENDDSALERKAIEIVNSHCTSHIGAEEIIVPFIIGVGDNVKATLNEYAKGFINGYFPIKGQSQKGSSFNRVFQLIGNSIRKSVNLNSMNSEVLNSIKHQMETVLEELTGK